ncbi:hypothetical protein N0K08_20565 [Acidovorax sp. Be4]|uniref:Uncharacterized protein n=1 Tax=Acidovorax bellezanensis TaxID=2976702 RepID=A0ABT2PRB6_9BURK|nr:hypothetical protein [Acidovorax sp. Be4]MCT9813028.1 hypothetical protein [Acidovorax sp. Be4]
MPELPLLISAAVFALLFSALVLSFIFEFSTRLLHLTEFAFVLAASVAIWRALSTDPLTEYALSMMSVIGFMLAVLMFRRFLKKAVPPHRLDRPEFGDAKH